MNPTLEILSSALSGGRRRPRPDPHHQALWAASKRSGSAVIIAVGGDVDASNEDAWRNLLSKIASTAIPPGPFVVDVRQMRFMGCGAFLVLAQVAQRCRRRGVNLCLVSDQPVVARIVAAAGLRPLLLMRPTVQAALSDKESPEEKGMKADLQQTLGAGGSGV